MVLLNLGSIIAKGRALFASPYTNFNLVLSLHIAQRLVMNKVLVHFLTDFGIRPQLFNSFWLDNHELLRLAKDLDCSCSAGGTLVAVVRVADERMLSLALDKFNNFFIFAHRIPAVRRCCSCNTYRVRRVNVALYSISSGDSVLLVKVVNGYISETGVPEEVLRVAEELRDVIGVFGCVKAGDFVKYLAKKLGCGKDEGLNLLRRAIVLGIVKYRNGYLCA